ETRFCVMAFGKLGVNELNYSSDIDLMGLYDEDGVSSGPGLDRDGLKRAYGRVMESLRSDLSDHTEEGYAYRVDLRLRPFGASGDLVPTLNGLLKYYRQRASLWEIQAAFKLRPVAGNISLGYGFLERLKPILVERRDRGCIVDSIEHMRRAAVRATARGIQRGTDVKSGFGGLRDVEFLVQGLQLIHAPDNSRSARGGDPGGNRYRTTQGRLHFSQKNRTFPANSGRSTDSRPSQGPGRIGRPVKKNAWPRSGCGRFFGGPGCAPQADQRPL
ncbi:MAG: hypothetical protein JRK53_04810, partial [Deltaproteobacteria bacterium]|nr:hypothetical protein [Deltaproteobacteria bacterium]